MSCSPTHTVPDKSVRKRDATPRNPFEDEDDDEDENEVLGAINR
jgi:hypothetical protein